MGSLVDLTGKTFGELFVISRANKHNNNKVYWHCRCSCGKEKDIVSSSLVSGETKGCGSGHMKKGNRFADITGKRFGALVAIKPIRSDGKGWIWECKCDCGNVCERKTSVLGHTKSCGCSSWRCMRMGIEPAKNKLFASYYKTARHKGIPFELSREQFFDLVGKSCYYCGNEPTNVSRTRLVEFIYNGIDRMDNSKGYTIDNCVPCCSTCNYAKRAMTQEQFRNWIKRIYINQYKKLSDKTPGELIDSLCTVVIKCFMAQEKIYDESLSESEQLGAAKLAQELNDRRNRLIRSIDELLDFKYDTPTEKSYHTYFKSGG